MVLRCSHSALKLYTRRTIAVFYRFKSSAIKKAFMVEKEPVRLMVGGSSADIRGEKEIEVK